MTLWRTDKTWSHGSNYIAGVVMWPKSGNSSIWKRELIITSTLYKDLTRKTGLFEGLSWVKFKNLGLILGMVFKFFSIVSKGFKLKARNFEGLTLRFGKVTAEKMYPPSWIELKAKFLLYGVVTSFVIQFIQVCLFKRAVKSAKQNG